MKRVHLALGVADDVEVSIDDSLQRLGCRSDLLVPGAHVLWRTDAVNLSIRRVGHEEGGARRGHGRAMWSGVAMLSNSNYLDGVLGRLNLLFLCAIESICFRALR